MFIELKVFFIVYKLNTIDCNRVKKTIIPVSYRSEVSS